MPVNWVLLLLLVAAFTNRKKLRKRTAWAAVIIGLIFSCPYLLSVVIIHWDVHTPLPGNTEKYNCAIVLGGFTSEGRNKEGFFNAAADRFIQAARLYNTGRIKKILISSGNGSLFAHAYSEPRWTREQLHEFNVPDSCILIEDKSRNTIENARFSKALLESRHIKPPYLLITSAFHMRRALMIFKKQGFNVVPYSCNYFTESDDFSFAKLLPDVSTFGGWGTYNKEIAGYMVNSLMK